jgi:hemolysin activation/secretion protein
MPAARLLSAVAGYLALAAPALAQSGGTEGLAAADAPRMMAPPVSFAILAIDVVGASRLPQGEIEKVVYPFMGPGKTPADVEAARKALQDAYARKGYEAVVVDVPPQPQEDFAAGVVRIAVTEAPVAKIAVTGAKYHSVAGVLRQLPSIKPGQPLNFVNLQRELADANRFPDREVEPSFDAGEEPGTIDVNLKVRDSRPVHASLALNNDNNPNTTDLRATGSVRYSNLWGAGHTITAGYSLAPRRRSDNEAYFGSYMLPFQGSNWTLLLSGYKSNSNVAALGGTNVLGNGYQVGLQTIYRLNTEKGYQAFNFGIDFKDFKQDIGLSGTTINRAPIRYITGKLGYDLSVTNDRLALDIGLSSTFGLRVIKRIGCFDPAATTCVPEDQFTNREVDSIENFTHYNLDTTLTVKPFGDWQSVLRVSGQFSDSHLVSNEQFAVGGLSTVRGYFQSEAVGDRGVFGSFELRTPSVATRLGKWADDARLFGFFDAGKAWVVNPLPDSPSSYRLGSYGGGIRIKLFGTLSGDLLVAMPLRSTTDTKRNDARVTFEVKGEL